jgi:hypothetical protein
MTVTTELDDALLPIAVAQQVYTYARAVDRMDDALMLTCFRPDAHILYGGKFEGTPQGFVDWLWPVHAAMVGHTHSISNVLVQHTATGLDSESYVVATLRMNSDDGPFDYVSRGRYLDRWERHDGGVRIIDRLYISDFRSTAAIGQRNTANQLPTNDIPPIRSSRDLDDASYARFAGNLL